MIRDSMDEKRALSAGFWSPWLPRYDLKGFLIRSSMKIYVKSPSLKISATNCD